jgi:transposase
MAPKREGKSKGGRPTKLTPEVRERILRVVRETGCFEDACRVAGIAESTLYDWKARGLRETSGQFSEFSEAIKRACADRRVGFEREIRKHGKQHWQAIAWLAERTEPARYALKVRIEVEQELTNALAKLRKRLPAEQYESVLDALAADDGPAEADGDSPEAEGAQPRGSEAVQPPSAEP